MQGDPVPKPLVEGRDYYVENGRWVFTEAYLRERGHCCESGCRHCPYGFQRATGLVPVGLPDGGDSCGGSDQASA